MIVPDVVDITIYQNSEWDWPIAWLLADGTPVDLTGCTAEMQIRPEAVSGVVIASLTEADGTVIMNGDVAPIWLKLTDEQTNALPVGRYAYDVKVFISTSGYRILQGKCYISPAVTR